jgi:hypothetical protein
MKASWNSGKVRKIKKKKITIHKKWRNFNWRRNLDVFSVDHNGDVVSVWPHSTPVQVAFAKMTKFFISKALFFKSKGIKRLSSVFFYYIIYCKKNSKIIFQWRQGLYPVFSRGGNKQIFPITFLELFTWAFITVTADGLHSVAWRYIDGTYGISQILSSFLLSNGAHGAITDCIRNL